MTTWHQWRCMGNLTESSNVKCTIKFVSSSILFSELYQHTHKIFSFVYLFIIIMVSLICCIARVRNQILSKPYQETKIHKPNKKFIVVIIRFCQLFLVMIFTGNPITLRSKKSLFSLMSFISISVKNL